MWKIRKPLPGARPTLYLGRRVIDPDALDREATRIRRLVADLRSVITNDEADRRSDLDYYRARLAAQLDASARAVSKQARAAHTELADYYRERIAMLEAGGDNDAVLTGPADSVRVLRGGS